MHHTLHDTSYIIHHTLGGAHHRAGARRQGEGCLNRRQEEDGQDEIASRTEKTKEGCGGEPDRNE